MKPLKNIQFILFTLLVMFTLIGYSQVNGNAFLFGQADHNGIKVKFIPNSTTAQLDSTITNINGSYSINLSGGLYQVLFTKAGYQDVYYNNGNVLAIATSETLSDITLQQGSAIYVSGNASGTWSANNIYIINENIIIPIDSTLNIEAGTILKFNGDYSIIANGTLLAIGSKSSPIIITSNFLNPSAGDWNKIEINNSSSKINFCLIEYCKYGFYFTNYSPTISNNEIRNFSEGGIYCLNCSPLISGNNIYNFNVKDYSWGIWVEGFNSKSIIECNTIYNGKGRGITTKSNNTVRNNTIYNITDPSRGTGIWVSNQCNPLIENNYIHSCRIGIDIGNSVNSIPDPLIVNNTINNNSYAGIYFNNYYAKGSVINNIIVANGYGIKQDVPGCAPLCSTTPDSVAYNLVWNNTNGDFYTVQITGIGQIVTTNSNGDPIDSYFNLSQDPLFVNNNPPVFSSNSPCINSGNQTYSANLGFDTSYTCQQIPSSINEFAKSNSPIKIGSYPNPFTDILNVTYSVPADTYVNIEIFDLLGRVQCQILNEFKKEGEYKISYNGSEIQSGLYIIKITTPDFKSNQNIVIKF